MIAKAAEWKDADMIDMVESEEGEEDEYYDILADVNTPETDQ